MLSLGILGFQKQHPLQHQNAASMVASINVRVLLVYYMRYASSTVYIANLARVTELLAPARFLDYRSRCNSENSCAQTCIE